MVTIFNKWRIVQYFNHARKKTLNIPLLFEEEKKGRHVYLLKKYIFIKIVYIFCSVVFFFCASFTCNRNRKEQDYDDVCVCVYVCMNVYVVVIFIVKAKKKRRKGKLLFMSTTENKRPLAMLCMLRWLFIVRYYFSFLLFRCDENFFDVFFCLYFRFENFFFFYL